MKEHNDSFHFFSCPLDNCGKPALNKGFSTNQNGKNYRQVFCIEHGTITYDMDIESDPIKHNFKTEEDFYKQKPHLHKIWKQFH